MADVAFAFTAYLLGVFVGACCGYIIYTRVTAPPERDPAPDNYVQYERHDGVILTIGFETADDLTEYLLLAADEENER